MAIEEQQPAASSSEDEFEEEVESDEEEKEEEDEDEDEEDESGSDEDKATQKETQAVSKSESSHEDDSDDSDEEEGSDEPEKTVSKPSSSGAVALPVSQKRHTENDDDNVSNKKQKSGESESSSSGGDDSEKEEEGSEPEKTVSKPSSSVAVVAPVSLKKHADNEKDDDNLPKKKKNKKKNIIVKENGVGSSSQPVQDSKKLFERLWSDDAEVVILKGMLDWHKQGDDPFANVGGFLDSIKESISFTFNKDQLNNKMRRLRGKFNKRGKVFKKPHDLYCYNLMKVVWDGKEVKPKMSAKPASLKQKTVASSSNVPNEAILAAALRLGKNLPDLSESVLKQGLALLGDSEVKDMENKWNIQQQAEGEVCLQRIDLMRELTAMVLNRIRASNP